jgi:hypothetical protein
MIHKNSIEDLEKPLQTIIMDLSNVIDSNAFINAFINAFKDYQFISIIYVKL